MQVTPHVYACHVDDGAVGHPGGSNNYFVGDPTEEMILIDTGQHDRSWTQQIIDYYEELGQAEDNRHRHNPRPRGPLRRRWTRSSTRWGNPKSAVTPS